MIESRYIPTLMMSHAARLVLEVTQPSGSHLVGKRLGIVTQTVDEARKERRYFAQSAARLGQSETDWTPSRVHARSLEPVSPVNDTQLQPCQPSTTVGNRFATGFAPGQPRGRNSLDRGAIASCCCCCCSVLRAASQRELFFRFYRFYFILFHLNKKFFYMRKADFGEWRKVERNALNTTGCNVIMR